MENNNVMENNNNVMENDYTLNTYEDLCDYVYESRYYGLYDMWDMENY